MNKYSVYFLWIIFTVQGLFIHTAWSTPSSEKKNEWICFARDATEHQWKIKSFYQRMATNKALEACKKESTAPYSCKTRNEYCNLIINSKTPHPLWRCTALDVSAQPYMSTVYSQIDEAALAAKDYCKELSQAPDTCAVNLVTCYDLNNTTTEAFRDE